MPHEKKTSRNHPLLNTWFTRSLSGAGSLGLLVTIFGFFGQYDWRLDLLSHFREQYILCFLLLLGITVFLKTRTGIIISLLGILLNVSPFIPFYAPRQSVGEGQSLVVLSANVEVDNTRYGRLLEYIARLKPDVIVLEEVNTPWLQHLQGLQKAFPYRVNAARNDYSGMLLLSRLPLEAPQVKHLGQKQLPSVVAAVQLADANVLIVGTHPYPPLGAEATSLRDDQIEQVGRFITAQHLPVVLVGDFNTSPFSYPYKRLLNETDLTDCANGFGYQSTWQYGLLFPPLGISLDHCFHTPDLAVVQSYVGEDIGSDHRPIVNRISLSPRKR